MKLIICLAAAAALTACAKQPEQIAAVEVGVNEYRSFSCSQLADAEVKYDQALTNLSAEQKSAANADAWGVFLIGLPISSMSGSDKETAIAVTKGQLQAISREQSRKQCG